MDYTNGIFDITNNVKRLRTTLARQLAYFVTIYSGMTMAADRPFMYEGEHKNAFKFIHDVPVNFEKTIPLAGEVGEYFIVARKERDSSNWYLGGVTDETARRVHINLDFLDPGVYRAEIYADAENAHYRDNPFAIDISTKHVSKNNTLELYLAPGGGFAIRLEKKS